MGSFPSLPEGSAFGHDIFAYPDRGPMNCNMIIFFLLFTYSGWVVGVYFITWIFDWYPLHAWWGFLGTLSE